jgi:glycosyltransferase involved in cell wall biosynthesis
MPLETQLTSQRPRIVHMAKLAETDVRGGISTAITAIARACRARGATSHVVTCRLLGWGGRLAVNGELNDRATSLGCLFSLPIAPTWPLLFQRSLRTADLVVVHAPFLPAAAAIAMHLPNEVGLVVHWHSDIVAQRRLGALLRPLIRKMLDRADAVIVSNPMLAKSPLLATVRGKLRIIPFGVDASGCDKPIPPAAAELATKLRCAHPRLVVALGRLVPSKGFDVLIEAMRNVAAHLLIIGEGNSRRWLERQIDRNDLADRVTLLGAVTDAERDAILRNSDVFVFPSVLCDETFGIAQLEAMACGLPIVNTALPTGVPWVAQHQREALTVPPNSPTAMAEAIERLLTDRALAARLGAAGHARAVTHFALATFERRVTQVYDQAMATRTTARHAAHPPTHPIESEASR